MKEFLRQKGVTFTEKDVSTDQQAFDELVKMGYSATAVTVIDDAAMVGFDRARLEPLLGA